MIEPGRLDLAADRWVACVRDFAFVGFDFSGATFAAQVRLTPDAPGDAIIDLSTVSTASAQGVRLVYAGSATVAEHIAAERLPEDFTAFALTDTVTMSTVGLRINETTMEGLPFPQEHGGDVRLAWDMHITPAAGVKDKYIGGDFVVRAGVTQ